jgi:hypothetical protein
VAVIHVRGDRDVRVAYINIMSADKHKSSTFE